MDTSNIVSIQSNLDFTNKRELGSEAVFTISTAKPGNGVDQLRDNNLDTYWQSDGIAPHLITIQFPKKVTVSQICFYCDYTMDESYTAKRVSIRSGTTMHDLIDITTIEINDPKGWVTINLSDNYSSNDSLCQLPLKSSMLQIRILSMHQNGRDTHIRQLKVLGPRSAPIIFADLNLESFTTTEMSQFTTFR